MKIERVEEIEDLLEEKEAMPTQTASLTIDKGSMRRKHSRVSLIDLMP